MLQIKVPKTSFNHFLIKKNNLKFHEWVFAPGMLFNATKKWWGDKGKRKKPHEGIDICFYKTRDNVIKRIEPGLYIPLIFDGTIDLIEKDYLGYSVFVAHDIFDDNKNQLYSIYGHTACDDSLKCGNHLRQGAIVGKVGDIPFNKNSICPHLHVSLVLLGESFDRKKISWESISSSESIKFLDPLQVINLEYSLISNIDETII